MELLEYKILEMFVIQMETQGFSHNLIYDSIEQDFTKKLNNYYSENYSLEEMHVAANKCLAHEWLKRNSVGAGLYGDLSITQKGLGVVNSKRKKVKEEKENVPNVTNNNFHLSGINSRVNLNSSDSSINLISREDSEIFSKLRKLLDEINDEDERLKIEETINAMESSVGTNDFTSKYQNFMSVIATHITVFTPMLPSLAGLLTVVQ